MESLQVADALAALGHETRLGIFRFLVERGPAGSAAGGIGRHFEIPGATLSFHLNHLKRVGLVRVRREGRSLIYSADFAAMSRLLSYLSDNCCGGEPCCETDTTPGED